MAPATHVSNMLDTPGGVNTANTFVIGPDLTAGATLTEVVDSPESVELSLHRRRTENEYKTPEVKFGTTHAEASYLYTDATAHVATIVLTPLSPDLNITSQDLNKHEPEAPTTHDTRNVDTEGESHTGVPMAGVCEATAVASNEDVAEIGEFMLTSAHTRVTEKEYEYPEVRLVAVQDVLEPTLIPVQLLSQPTGEVPIPLSVATNFTSQDW
jgi:hypothetical protein